jgi:hypothetical protein
MNTRQAYTRYGVWATLSGYATYLRHSGGVYSLDTAVRHSRKGNERWVHGSTGNDHDFPDEALRAIVTRARLRLPKNHL